MWDIQRGVNFGLAICCTLALLSLCVLLIFCGSISNTSGSDCTLYWTVSCYHLSHDEGNSHFRIMLYRTLLPVSALFFLTVISFRKQEEEKRLEKRSCASSFSLMHMGIRNENPATISPVAYVCISDHPCRIVYYVKHVNNLEKMTSCLDDSMP